MRAIVLVAILLLLPSSASGQSQPDDFTVDIDGDKATVTQGADAHLVPTLNESRNLAWGVDITKALGVGTLRIRGWDVERARQVVPEVNASGASSPADRYFAEHAGRDVEKLDAPALVFNETSEAGVVVLRVGFPRGAYNFSIRRDVTPPSYHLDSVGSPTHDAVLVKSSTDEYAQADLIVQPEAGGEAMLNPTAIFALHQTFPVQGLKSDTAYVAHFEFNDFAQNVARSPTFRFHTLPRPVLPAPEILSVEPRENATLDAAVSIVRVVSRDAHGFGASPVRLFVDKQEVRDYAFSDGNLSYRLPTPLGPGKHSVNVELTGAAGGTTVRSWVFTVKEKSTPSPTIAFALVATMIAGVCFSRRKRSGRP